MSRSAALERWLCSSTSFILMPSASRYAFTAFVATLSMMLSTGLKFHFLKYSMFVLNASTVVPFLNFYWCGEDGVGGPILEYENICVAFHGADVEVAGVVDVDCSRFWFQYSMVNKNLILCLFFHGWVYIPCGFNRAERRYYFFFCASNALFLPLHVTFHRSGAPAGSCFWWI